MIVKVNDKSTDQQKELCIYHHLGVGDIIDCNGMVRFIADNSSFEKINIFIKSQHADMVKYMYRDNKKIHIVPITAGHWDPNEGKEVEDFVKKDPDRALQVIGHQFYDESLEKSKNINCWEQFYMLANLDLNVRWDYFHLEEDEKLQKELYDRLNPNDEPYIFIHDDPSRGYEVDRKKVNSNNLKIITNDISENMFHFVDIIKRATEIHCMESSFKSLVELIGTPAKMYFHNFRGHPLGFNSASRGGWEIVEYGRKND